jgi:hypothetical protein
MHKLLQHIKTAFCAQSAYIFFFFFQTKELLFPYKPLTDYSLDVDGIFSEVRSEVLYVA